MGALGTGKRRGNGQGSGIGRRHLDLHALMPEQVHAGAPKRPDDRARCTLFHGSRKRSHPDRRAPPRCHIAHRAAAGHVLAATGRQRDTDEWRRDSCAGPPGIVRSRGCQTNRASGSYGLEQRLCVCEQSPRTCVQCSQEHRPHLNGERLEAGLRLSVRRVGGPLPACRRCQKRSRGSLLDPTDPRFASPARLWRGGDGADRPKTACAVLRRAPPSTLLKIGRVPSDSATGPDQTRQ
jgi:hypothetical protein